MPRSANPADIPDRLVKSGLELFLLHGYNATGIQQITDRAGVPKGSFYNHFPSKEGFAAAVVDRYAQYMKRSWERFIDGAPAGPLAAIRHVFDQMLDYHERTPEQVGCLIGNFAAEVARSSETCRLGLMSAQLGWRERLAGLIGEAQAHGQIRGDIDATALSALTWNAWEGALLRMKVEQTTQPVRESVALIFEHLLQPVSRG
jgi:TetR/AcrR family transcriptional repressor of nem operon